MYLIPKNLKVKKEIFKGIGIFELIGIFTSCLLGFILQSFVNHYKLKIILFCIFPLMSLLLLIPLSNGNTILNILTKFIIYQRNQKNYRYYKTKEEESDVYREKNKD